MSIHFSSKITDYFYPLSKEYTPPKRGRELSHDGETEDDDRLQTKQAHTINNQFEITNVEHAEQKTPPAPRKIKQALPTPDKKLGKLFV